MKKLLVFSIFGLLLIGIVSAGLISISVWDKDISLNTTITDRIKDVADVQTINVEIGKIQCDTDECWATLYQKDLIQTEWKREKAYCNEWSVIEDSDDINQIEIPEPECLSWIEYTLEENKQAIQDYLEDKLNKWSVIEEQRQNKIIEDKTEIGTIKENVEAIRK